MPSKEDEHDKGYGRAGVKATRSEVVPTPGKRSLTDALEPIPRRAARASGLLPAAVQREAARPDAGSRPTLLSILEERRIQKRQAAVEPHAARDGEAGVRAAAEHGISGPADHLPHLEPIQRSFGGHDVSRVEAHVGGPAAAGAKAMGAEAYATGNHVAFAEAPSLHTAAHEAAHVIQQQGGVQLKGGVGQAGDVYERHADAVADAVVAGKSAEPLLDQMPRGDLARAAVQRKEGKDDAQVLESQAHLKSTDVEIPALEGALLSTRIEAVTKGLLSKPAFDASLDLSKAMTQLQPAVAANGAVDAGVQERAALAAQLLFMALQRETADDRNFRVVSTMGGGAEGGSGAGGISEENPYTKESRITTSLLFTTRTRAFAGPLAQLPGLIRQRQWGPAFDTYRELTDGLDRWVADQLRKSGKGTPDEARGNAHAHYAQLRTALEQIAGKHATRLPALFHPNPKTVEKEKAAGRPAVETVPMNVYVWKDEDGKVHLHDLTTPSVPHQQVIDREPTAEILNTFFEEVGRYPEGEVRYTLPRGGTGIAPTTGKTKWYEWVAYAGLALAAIGLALTGVGLLVESAVLSVATTACFAGGALAGGVSAGGHLADTAHLGTATTATVVLDVAQIVASFASVGVMSIAVKAGGVAAALAGSRYFVPLVSSAAVADSVQLVALTDITVGELNQIQNGAGSPEDKQRAMAVLLTQLIVAGGLTALSVQGARNIRANARTPLELVDQNGVKVLRVVGEDASLPANAPAKSRARVSHDAEHATGDAEDLGASRRPGNEGLRPLKKGATVTVTGLAQKPKTYPWRTNSNGVARTVEDVKRIALEHGVEIPDDIAIFAVKAKWLPPDTYATYMARDFAPGQRVSWQEFYNKYENIAVKISGDILDSDEAIVAVMAHEMHELNGLRKVFEERQTIPAEELGRMINPGYKGNLHDQAWDVADSLVAKMRRDGLHEQ